MTYTYRDYFKFELPKKWCVEENESTLSIYNPKGNGAITVSVFNALEEKEYLSEQIKNMMQSFIEQYSISISGPTSCINYENKTVLSAEGATDDKWFIKIWYVAKYPKIVFATYHSEKKTLEIKKCDAIIDSIEFLF